MNKLLNNITSNKNFRRWLGIILAIALVATMFPYMSAAYGNNDEPVQQDEPVLVEPGDNTIISEEVVEEETPEQEEITDPQGEEPEQSEEAVQAPMMFAAPRVANINRTYYESKEEDNINITGGTNYIQVEPGVTLTCNITVSGGATLYLRGAGTIQGKGNGSVITVKGNNTKLILNDDKDEITNPTTDTVLTITGGVGSNFKDKDKDMFVVETGVVPNTSVGGGIQVVRKDAGDQAELEMFNGYITNNRAQAGGGIFIDRNCKFTMHNGVVDDNQATTINGGAAHEGGGIFLAGGTKRGYENNKLVYKLVDDKTAKIEKGQIINNTSDTQHDWGGGGVFIESKGNLKVGNVLITSNTAQGLGGGISGCPHANMGIGDITEGAAIYGNTAQKTPGHNPQDPNLQDDHYWLWDMEDNVRGDIIAWDIGKDANEFTADKAMDFYCTKASVVYSKTTTWNGRLAYYTPQKEFNNKYGTDVSIPEGGKLSVDGASLGLTATLIKPIDRSKVNVIIENNTSNTHGGGIGCNGTLSIGALGQTKKESGSFNLEFKKELIKLDGDSASIPADTYSFDLYADEGCTQQLGTTAKNDENGKVSFKLDGYKEGKYTFYVKEQAIQNDYVSYDQRKHKVEVVVKKKETSAFVFPNTETSVIYYVPDGGITYFVEEGSNKYVETTSEGKAGNVFTNKVRFKEIPDEEFPDWGININKEYLDGNGYNVFKKPDAKANEAKKQQFNFTLYGTDNASEVGNQDEAVGNGTLLPLATVNSNNGQAVFTFTDSDNGQVNIAKYKNVIKDQTKGESKSAQLVFYVKENAGTESNIDYDTSWHTVKVTIKKETNVDESDKASLEPIRTITDVYSLDSVKVVDQENADVVTFTNQFIPRGVLELPVLKYFYGDSTNKVFEFGLKQLKPNSSDNEVFAPTTMSDSFIEPEANDQVIQVEYGENGGVQKGTNFELVYKPAENENGTHANPQSVVKDYWYKIAETQGVNANDSTVYVVKVNVQIAEDGMSYVPTVKEIYWAVDGNGTSQLEKLWTSDDKDQNGAAVAQPPIEFFNNDDQVLNAMSVGGFAVYAASGEPVTEKCLVDPKIIKELKGYQTEQGEKSARSMKPGEFKFSLIQVATPSEVGEDGQYHPDWNDVSGAVISTTSNDQYGMVDFDKAAPVEGTEDDPCCLLFTQPGTYFYRVIEDKQVNSDPSVDYSDAIITFTAVVEKVDGALKTTDMYYGHVENGENVRYTESENPQWHPTMTNYARGMDLQVRKTSALDRENGLEGATYGLYAVNNGAQADIFLGEGTSNEDGWITFKNVSLNEGTLYYFKERLAPAGHTVSEFRSSYFYIVKDPSAPNGYTMMYTDSKADLGSKADASDIVALEEAQDEQNGTQGGTPQGAQSEDGNMLFTFEQDGGVFDEATYTEIAKVDTRTHEWVEGAELSIVEKDSGKVINSWKSGTAVEVLQGKLNVDTTYILREDKAPEGYAKANDVEFKIDQYGAIEILSGTSNGNAELQDATIRLYDTMLDAEVVETVQKENVIETPDNSAGGLSKTGDYLPIAGVALLALGSLIVLLVIARKKRNSKEQ